MHIQNFVNNVPAKGIRSEITRIQMEKNTYIAYRFQPLSNLFVLQELKQYNFEQ